MARVDGRSSSCIVSGTTGGQGCHYSYTDVVVHSFVSHTQSSMVIRQNSTANSGIPDYSMSPSERPGMSTQGYWAESLVPLNP